MISRAKDDGSWTTIHSDDPASRGGAASGDVSPKAATGVGVLRRGLALGLVALAALVFAVPSEAQNTAPTGKPTIDGTPHAGEILTASVSGIADADGLTTPGYTYQWIRVLRQRRRDEQHCRGHRLDLYPHRGRRDAPGPGAGDVHRRRRHRRDGDQ